jgi:hypothetical protein
MPYLIMTAIGFGLICIGAIGYLQSTVVEKHSMSIKTVFVDGKNNVQLYTISDVLNKGYIIKKAKKK